MSIKFFLLFFLSANRVFCDVQVTRDENFVLRTFLRKLHSSEGANNCAKEDKILWHKDGRCYKAGTQGPCRQNEWIILKAIPSTLLFKKEVESVCVLRPCLFRKLEVGEIKRRRSRSSGDVTTSDTSLVMTTTSEEDDVTSETATTAADLDKPFYEPDTTPLTTGESLITENISTFLFLRENLNIDSLASTINSQSEQELIASNESEIDHSEFPETDFYTTVSYQDIKEQSDFMTFRPHTDKNLEEVDDLLDTATTSVIDNIDVDSFTTNLASIQRRNDSTFGQNTIFNIDDQSVLATTTILSLEINNNYSNTETETVLATSLDSFQESNNSYLSTVAISEMVTTSVVVDEIENNFSITESELATSPDLLQESDTNNSSSETELTTISSWFQENEVKYSNTESEPATSPDSFQETDTDFLSSDSVLVTTPDVFQETESNYPITKLETATSPQTSEDDKVTGCQLVSNEKIPECGRGQQLHFDPFGRIVCVCKQGHFYLSGTDTTDSQRLNANNRYPERATVDCYRPGEKGPCSNDDILIPSSDGQLRVQCGPSDFRQNSSERNGIYARFVDCPSGFLFDDVIDGCFESGATFGASKTLNSYLDENFFGR